MASQKKESGSNFLVQGSILAMASLVSRVIGLIYRIPMTNIIGDVGNNYYACAYDVYNVMLIISSYSLPLAVSKLVSAQMAKKNRRKAYQVLKGALLFALVAGTAVALIVYFGAKFFTTTLLKTPYSIFALRVLAPALIVVAVLGVIRGFFQGMGTMVVSAVSQIIEQIVNAIVSVWAAYVLYQYGMKVGAVLGNADNYAAAYGAAGGTLGTNLGSVAALIFVLIVFMVYMRSFRRHMNKSRNVKVDPFWYTLKILVITIIPVLLSTTIYNISGIVDQAIFKNIALLQGATEADIDVWWGVFSGKYKLMINVPISIASAMASSSVPALTRSFGQGDMDAVRSEIGSASRFIMIIAFPCAVGLTVLSDPIFRVLFPSTASTAPLANQMMLVGSIAVVFYSLSTLSNGLLQGINRLKIPVMNAAIALVAHVILLVLLMLIFRMKILAVVISSTVFALLMCILNGIAIAKHSGYKQEIKKTFLIPAICSVIMGIITWLVYKGIYTLSEHMLVSMCVAIVIAVIVYAMLLLLFHELSEDELRRFPKGDLIVRIVKKLHLM